MKSMVLPLPKTHKNSAVAVNEIKHLSQKLKLGIDKKI